MLSKEQILAAPDLKTERVPVPEWGGDVLVSEMTAASNDAFQLGLYEGDGDDRRLRQENMRSRLLSFCLVDESGARLFSEADIDALGRKNGKVISRLFDVAQRLNKADEEAIEEAKKPSNATPGSGSE